MQLKDIDAYQKGRELSKRAWSVYSSLDWQIKRLLGDQWMRAVDSVSANIAEGYGRFHYLDKNKFNYNARGSLVEALHWTELLSERGIISEDDASGFMSHITELHRSLNMLIKITKEQVKNKT